MDKTRSSEIYRFIITLLNKGHFEAPIGDRPDPDFPRFIKCFLDTWYANILPELSKLDEIYKMEGDDGLSFEKDLKNLINVINLTIVLYVAGNTTEATELFNKAMDEYLRFRSLTDVIPVDSDFYRARKGTDKDRVIEELFHVAFHNKHRIPSNRFTIANFPALYLSDHTYVCWEEVSRHSLDDLWFSRFTNKRYEMVVTLKFFDQFYSDIATDDDSIAHTKLLRYIATFPLLVACLCKAKEPKSDHPPEYIISQLLLQYISQQNVLIAGIQYPSTKFDYKNLQNITPYNFVFPAKSNNPKGFCSSLTKGFHLTKPIKLPLDKLIDDYDPTTLIKMDIHKYQSSCFGKGESELKTSATVMLTP